MKTAYTIILFLAAMSISCSNKGVVLTEDELPEDRFYLQDQIKPYTGKCFIYFHNTELLKEELNFKDGILHGERISYYRNGQIKQIGSFVEGRYHGVWKGYSSCGKQIFYVEYDNDKLKGKYCLWYPTGVPKEKGKYDSNLRSGEWEFYDSAGMIIKKTVL